MCLGWWGYGSVCGYGVLGDLYICVGCGDVYVEMGVGVWSVHECVLMRVWGFVGEYECVGV